MPVFLIVNEYASTSPALYGDPITSRSGAVPVMLSPSCWAWGAVATNVDWATLPSAVVNAALRFWAPAAPAGAVRFTLTVAEAPGATSGTGTVVADHPAGVKMVADPPESTVLSWFVTVTATALPAPGVTDCGSTLSGAQA